MTKSPLRVLCIEDLPADAELLEAHLSLNDFDVTLARVETPDELNQALTQDWDIALADYSLPHLNAGIALQMIKNSGKDLPVIVVSGTIGENRAIEMMKAGARDFIIKGDFLRLIPAIRRELVEAENRAALLQSKESFRRLANAMPALVWTIAPDGSMSYANERFHTYSGCNKEQLLGWAWTSILRPAEIFEKYRLCIESGQEFSLEHQLRSHDGSLRWFLTRATPSRNERNQIVTWYATTIDIHEQKMVAEELHNAKIAAEKANEAKSAFLANMSHEIRTPLAAILGFAELMDDPGQSESDRKECISTIRRNGTLLSKVINEILDLSKIEFNKLEIERISFDLNEMLEDVRTLMDLTAKEKGLELIFRQDSNVPKTVVSDPTRMKQILINMIGNALKFTHHGRITVTSRLIQPHASLQNAILRIEVADTGIGISQRQAENLFQPFVQVDNSMTRKYGGTGLGLNLSRKLAQALGGDVVLAKSELNQGSTFVLTFQVGLNPGF